MGTNLEELAFEAYGPGGSAILIEALSDNKNRTVQEIKLILKERGGKWAETGSVLWAFEKTDAAEDGWIAKFPQDIPDSEIPALLGLLGELEDNEAVQGVYTNAKIVRGLDPK